MGGKGREMAENGSVLRFFEKKKKVAENNNKKQQKLRKKKKERNLPKPENGFRRLHPSPFFITK
jgi:hypothetical protein